MLASPCGALPIGGALLVFRGILSMQGQAGMELRSPTECQCPSRRRAPQRAPSPPRTHPALQFSAGPSENSAEGSRGLNQHAALYHMSRSGMGESRGLPQGSAHGAAPFAECTVPLPSSPVPGPPCHLPRSPFANGFCPPMAEPLDGISMDGRQLGRPSRQYVSQGHSRLYLRHAA